MLENHYEGVTHVVHITTDDNTTCEECAAQFNQTKIADAINHYIENHGYKLLHIGTETTRDTTDRIWHNTAALLGK